MKKIISVLLVMALCKTGTTQVVIALLFGKKLNAGKLTFGIVVTPSLTNISDIEGKYKTGLNLGIYFDIKMANRFSFHIEGIAKGSYGAKSVPPYTTGNDSLDYFFAGGSIQRNIKAFSLPALARYSITDLLFVEAGIQPDMILKVRDIFKNKVNDNELEYTLKVDDQYTLLDFGLAGGLHYQFSRDKRSMGIGLRYFYGLTDIYKTKPGVQANMGWHLSITIPIGVGKTSDENHSTK